MSIFLSVLYDEPDPHTYRGIEVHGKDGFRQVVDTGNPQHDYFTVGVILDIVTGGEAIVMESSSIHHFAMDGGPQLDFAIATDEQIEAAVEAGRRLLKDEAWAVSDS